MTDRRASRTAAGRTDPRPWYRQFWPWFLIALPMTAVIGGIVTVVIAMRVDDPVLTSTLPADPPHVTAAESDA